MTSKTYRGPQGLDVTPLPTPCFVCRRFDDFDDAIDEAIEEDIGDVSAGDCS